LGLKIFLTLEDGSDIALKFDDFASDGDSGLGSNETAGNSAEEHGAGEDGNVTGTHERSLQKYNRGIKN
jgi:hypothetical protein